MLKIYKDNMVSLRERPGKCKKMKRKYKQHSIIIIIYGIISSGCQRKLHVEVHIK